MKYLAAILLTAGAILGTFFYGQSVGKGKVYAEWTADKLTRSEEARKKEASLQAAKQEVEKKLYDYEQTTKQSAARSDAAISSLQRTIAERERRFNPGTIAQANAETATYRQFFGQCTERYAELGKRADEVNLVAYGLQGYVGAVLSGHK